MAIKITNQADREDVMMWVSDLYKDVYGIRPRGYNFNAFSNSELEKFVNRLIEQSEEEAQRIAAAEQKAIDDVMSLGADKETALRWLEQADAICLYEDPVTAEERFAKYEWLVNHFDKKS
jgi:hypothetical protein